MLSKEVMNGPMLRALLEERSAEVPSRVFSLEKDFRRKCEAYMALEIIKRLDGINFDDDLYYLGLVLYRRGKEKAVAADDLKARTDELLAFMQENGDIEMGDDRIIRARGLHQPKTS